MLRGDIAPRPGVDWPQFRGISRRRRCGRLQRCRPMERRRRQERRVEDGRPRARAPSPIVWGDDDLRLDVDQRQEGRRPEGRPLRRHRRRCRTTPTHEWRDLRLDKKTGKVKWQQTVSRACRRSSATRRPRTRTRRWRPTASGSIAIFGSEGLYAYDMNGKLLWKKDLGVLDAGFYMAPEAQWETGSSPIIHDGMVDRAGRRAEGLVPRGVRREDRQRNVARDARPTCRRGARRPMHQVGGQTQILVNGCDTSAPTISRPARRSGSSSGGGDIPVPTPVVSDGLIYITNAHGRTSPVYAIKETATGDIALQGARPATTHVAWSVSARRRLHVHAARLPRAALHRHATTAC